MFHYNALRYFLCIGMLVLWANCQTPGHIQFPAINAYFQPIAQKDTLHIEVSDEEAVQGNTIPNRLFFTSIPTALLQSIDYLADSSQALVLSRQKFSIDNHITAYWVEIRQFWFQHHSLFLYDASKKLFTDRITVAEWYGGDGGQVLIGSWLFDYNGDDKKDIVRREIQHSMVPNGDEPLERVYESASLLLWKNGRFEDTAIQDTAVLVRQFHIRSFW